MKYRIFITAVIAILIAATNANATTYIGDITSAPAKQVQQMIVDFKAGDLKKAQAYIVEPSDKKKKEIADKYNKQVIDKLSNGELSYKVIDSKISGSWAVVAVGVDRNLSNNGEVIKSGWLRNEVLYKNGDQWVIIPQAIRYKDPKVDSWKNDDFEKAMDWWRYEIRKTISEYNPQKQKALAQAKANAEKQKAKK